MKGWPASATNRRSFLASFAASRQAFVGEAQDQALLGIAVQKGAIAPATITATPVSGGPTITYARNDAVAQEISEVSQGTDNPWPPAGTEGIGYLSTPFTQPQGAWEWVVDANFGLPPAADDGSFGGPFQTSLWVGAREIGGESGPADRPIECHPEGEPWTLPDDADQASCKFAAAGELGTSDLKIAAPAQAAAYLGGKAAISSRSTSPPPRARPPASPSRPPRRCRKRNCRWRAQPSYPGRPTRPPVGRRRRTRRSP